MVNESRVLNQLFAAQSMLSVFPDIRKLGEFIVQAVRSVPGVLATCLVIRGQSEGIGAPFESAEALLSGLNAVPEDQKFSPMLFPFEPQVEVFSLKTNQRQFGYVLVQFDDDEVLDIFRPALRNFFNMVAVRLENIWQNERMRLYQEHLEELVAARTLALDAEIARRKQAQEELQRSEQLYHDLVETAQDLIWQCDTEGRFIFLNHAWEHVLGYKLDEMLARKFTDFLHPQKANKDFAEHTRLLTGSSISKYETIYLAKNGQAVTLIFNAKYCMNEQGQTIGTRGSAYDITAYKRAEEQLKEAQTLLEHRVAERTADLLAANLQLEKASRLKNEFLASMGHELRTPLTGILGLSEVLQLQSYGEVSAKQLTALKHIQSSGQQLLDIINNILEYASLESGKLLPNLMSCALADVCKSSLLAVGALAAQKHQQTSLVISTAAVFVRADLYYMKKMLSCLLCNAIKFTPEGGSLGIEVTSLEPEHLVRITVWDTGIGINSEDIPRLFQPFIQLDARLAREYNGIGLGLALVKKMVDLQGGNISVESIFGSGSRFTISLPGGPVGEMADGGSHPR